MIGSVVVVGVVIVIDTNLTCISLTQHLGICATCKLHEAVAIRGKLAPAPSNPFNTTGVCSICRLSDAFCGPPFFDANIKRRRLTLRIYVANRHQS